MTRRDLDPQGTSQRGPGLLDRIENVPHRPVAHRMQVQIDAVAVQLPHQAAQPPRREQHGAVVAGVRGIGFQHGGGKNVLHPVVMDLDGVEPELAVAVLFPQAKPGRRSRCRPVRNRPRHLRRSFQRPRHRYRRPECNHRDGKRGCAFEPGLHRVPRDPCFSAKPGERRHRCPGRLHRDEGNLFLRRHCHVWTPPVLQGRN